MNSKFINVLLFAAGAAIGSAVAWKITKTRYERIVQEELESIKEAFAGNELDVAQEETENVDEDEEGQRECAGQINWDELEDLDEDEDDEDEMDEYVAITERYSGEKGGAEKMAKEPYVISPFDFGEADGYHEVELTYYEGDDTLEDEEYNVITNREELIGPKALHTFGEYEEDSVFVRNERLQTDFQILKDYRSYEQARGAGPKQVRDE